MQGDTSEPGSKRFEMRNQLGNIGFLHRIAGCCALSGCGTSGLSHIHAAALNTQRGKSLAVSGQTASCAKQVGIIRRDQRTIGDISRLLQEISILLTLLGGMNVDRMNAMGNTVLIMHGVDIFLTSYGMYTHDAAGLADAGLHGNRRNTGILKLREGLPQKTRSR